MQCLRVIAEQLRKSRKDLATRLFNVWAAYLDNVCRISEYFIRIIVNQSFRSDASTMAIEQGWVFSSVQCFRPFGIFQRMHRCLGTSVRTITNRTCPVESRRYFVGKYCSRSPYSSSRLASSQHLPSTGGRNSGSSNVAVFFE